MNATTNLSLKPVRFAGSELPEKHHICAFFRNPEEEYQVLLPFIKEGIEFGEKAFHVVNPLMLNDHARRLESAGIDVEGTAKSGQFQFCDWNQAYMPDGRFDQDRMLAMWQDVMNAAQLKGYARTRLIAHMEWALEEREGVSDLIEYEARLNLCLNPRDPVICNYDLTKFSGDIIMDVLRTHPTVIVGGILQKNPFYVEPEQFLEEIRERRANSGRSRTTVN